MSARTHEHFLARAHALGYSGAAATHVARLAVVRYSARRQAAVTPAAAADPLLDRFRRYARDRGCRVPDAVLARALVEVRRRMSAGDGPTRYALGDGVRRPRVRDMSRGDGGLATPAVIRYGKAGGRWITIGGRKGEDGKRHGGSPVYVEGGRITKGAPALAGKKIGALDAPAEAVGGHRKQLGDSPAYERARWAKKAKADGIDPKHLHQLAAEMVEHDKEFKATQTKMLQDARRQLKHYGYDPRALGMNLRAGRVEDEIPALDVVSESMANSYPELFHGREGGTGGFEGRLLELLTAGNPEPMTEDEAYEQALDHLNREKEGAGQGGGDASFDFGANADEEPLPYRRALPVARYAGERKPQPSTPAVAHPWQRPLPAAQAFAGAHWQEAGGTGFNPAHVVTTPAGGRFFVKTPHPTGVPRLGIKPQQHQVGVEMAVNKIHHLIGVPHVPRLAAIPSPLTGPGGTPSRALVSHVIPGAAYQVASNANPALIARARLRNAPEDVGRMALGNWLVNAQDRHANNYMLHPSGLIVPIDYGLSLYPHHRRDDFGNGGEDAIVEHPRAVTKRHLIPQNHPLDKDMLQRIRANKDAIMGAVEEHALPGYQKQRGQRMLDVMERKLQTVKNLSRRVAPTLADLPHEATPRVKRCDFKSNALGRWC